MEFVFDILPHLFAQQGGRSFRGRARPTASGVGRIYNGEMPSTQWIQSEQRATVNNSNLNSNLMTRNADEIRNSGNEAFKTGNYEKALDLYTEAINLEKEMADKQDTSEQNNSLHLSYCNRSLVYYRLQRFEASASDARDAIRVNYSYFKGHYRLAAALEELGELDNALKEYNKALELVKNDKAMEEIKVACAKCQVKALRIFSQQPTASEVEEVESKNKTSTPKRGFNHALPISQSISDILQLYENQVDMIESSAISSAASVLPSILKSLKIEIDEPIAYDYSSLPSVSSNDKDIIQGISQWEQASLSWERIIQAASAIQSARTKLIPGYKPTISSNLESDAYSSLNYRPLIESIINLLNSPDYSAQAKKLISMCDPELISSAEESAQQAQNKLREVALGDTKGYNARQEYKNALKNRDKRYNELWSVVDNAVSAIDALHLMIIAVCMKKPNSYPKSPKSSLLTILPKPSNIKKESDDVDVNSAKKIFWDPISSPLSLEGHIIPSVHIDDPDLIPKMLKREEIIDLLKQHQENKKLIDSKFKRAIKRTDALAASFLEALETERTTIVEEILPLQSKCAEIEKGLIQHLKAHSQSKSSTDELTTLNLPDDKITPLRHIGVNRQQIEAIESLQPRLKRLRSDIIVFQNSGKKGQELLDEEANLEHERLKLEKHRIQLEGDLEWLAVKEDDDPHRSTRLRDSLNIVKERLKTIVEKQQYVHKQLIELIRTDHPELSWYASAGGSKSLKWLKGSGFWVNYSFSDFVIVKTLASSINSRVYRARTRRGEEIALKEIGIEGEEKHKAFQNEVNVMVSCTSHPNIIKFNGAFFDGPFAYIIMPFYSLGSLKNVLERLVKFFESSKASDSLSNVASSTARTSVPSSSSAPGDISSLPSQPSHPLANLPCILSSDDNSEIARTISSSEVKVTDEGDSTLKEGGFPWFRIQEIFRQIVSGVAYLHERGIVHADIKPSNILLTEDFTPIITDFGVAKDIGLLGEHDVTQSGLVVGTFDFMAPEIQVKMNEGKVRITTKSDIWSLGMSFFSICSINARLNGETDEIPSMPILCSDSIQINISERQIGGNERLANLITSMLQKDPLKRPSANELLTHPYFTVSLVQDMVTNRELIQSNNKMEAFRSFLHAIRQGSRSPFIISVVRGQMVESLCSIFTNMKENDLLSPLFVVFRGEDGIDEGALTAEMFHLYFHEIITKHKILVHSNMCASDSEADVSNSSRLILPGTEYLPSCDPRISINMFNVLGRVLLKCLIESRNIPFVLGTSIFKYFLNVPLTMQDLESYDKVLATNLKRLLILSEEDLIAASIDFSDFSLKFLASKQGIDISKIISGNMQRDEANDKGKLLIIPETKVTIANVRDYVQWRYEYELFGKREAQLKALKEGFEMSDILKPHLQLFSVTELMMQLCGQQHISPTIITDSLQFVDFPSTSDTPKHLKEIIQGFSQNNMRRFLRLCTTNVVVPASGLQPIKIQCVRDIQRLPVGHACANQLDLPDYNNKELLKEKLGTSLAHVNDGFLIV